MAHIIDGKLVSSKIKENIKSKVIEFKEKHTFSPFLAVISVGNDPASVVYIRNKIKSAKEVGIYANVFHYPEDVSEREILYKIDELNNSRTYDGILVQLPLPKHISEKKVTSAISPKKDVDAFHPENVGKIFLGNYDFLPCTPAGIIKLLEYYNVEISGSNCVVIGRSNIVGKPMAHLLLERNGTVTVCHSKTKNLAEITKQADILIVAVGKPQFVTADMVKEGAVVIDVGINRVDGKIVGDVDFDSVSEVASYITPVPGGVGVMTVAMLLENTLKAAEMQMNNI